MALLSTQVLPDNTLEEFRIEFNKLVTDVSGLSLGNTFDTQIIFEGDTDDTFETAISVTDPTADRSIVFPNASGNVLLDSTNIALADSIEIQLGDGTDLKIYHDGSNSIIRDNGTGSLFLEGDAVVIRNAASNETMANFTQDGAVSLFHNNAVKLATSAAGTDVTGSFTVSAGGTVGIPTDTDLLTLTSAVLTVAGEVVGTGFTGTLDGVLGGGTAAAATVTTLNTSGAVVHNDAGAAVDFRVEGDTDPFLLFCSGTEDDVTIGGSTSSLFNGAGTSAKLAVVGSSNVTTLANNGEAAIVIVNTDQTDENLAGLHFARADTDDTPNYAGASIVAQFKETQATGQYPSATLNFLTSPSQNAAPSLKMTLDQTGNLALLTDGKALSFGADGDVTLTHVADTGLLLNSTMAIQFNDASQFIKGSSNAILDLGATDKIGLTATLIEVNGNQTTSGTYTGGGIIKTDDTTAATTTTDGSLQTDGGLSVVGAAIIGADISILSTVTSDNGDLGEINFHNTTNAGSGSGTSFVNQVAAIQGKMEGTGNNSGGSLHFITKADGGSRTEVMSLDAGGDLKLLSDSAVIHFGADSDITLTHAADTSLTTNGVMIATTFEPSADTAAGDNAAIGYTSAEGLILTGQGSTSDVTIKNDADATVLSIPTGTQTVQIDGVSTDDFLVIKTTEAGASSAPDVVLYRLSSSPADDDSLGKVVFRGRNDNTQDVEYAQIISQAIDVSDGTEDGRMYLQTKVNGSDVNHITLDANGATFAGNIVIPNTGTIGSAGNTNTITISAAAENEPHLKVDGLVEIESPTNTGTGGTSWALIAKNSKTDNTTGSNVMRVQLTNISPGDSNHMFQCLDGGSTVRFFVQNNGTRGGTSDRRLKENIVDATDKLTELRQLKVRNYNWIEHGPLGGFKELGFIAQEVEEVFPKMVRDNPENGHKMLLDDVFVPILVKSLQEAADKIDTLEARIKTLEDA